MRIHSVAEQERTDRRRAQILAAASRVFARHGFHRATVRQVAQEAGIADGTVYLYFRSKRELLLALLGQLGRVGERPADFAAHAGADARGFASAYLEQRFRQLRGWRQLFAARSEEHTSELQSQSNLVCRLLLEKKDRAVAPRVSAMGED